MDCWLCRNDEHWRCFNPQCDCASHDHDFGLIQEGTPLFAGGTLPEVFVVRERERRDT